MLSSQAAVRWIFPLSTTHTHESPRHLLFLRLFQFRYFFRKKHCPSQGPPRKTSSPSLPPSQAPLCLGLRHQGPYRAVTTSTPQKNPRNATKRNSKKNTHVAQHFSLLSITQHHPVLPSLSLALILLFSRARPPSRPLVVRLAKTRKKTLDNI